MGLCATRRKTSWTTRDGQTERPVAVAAEDDGQDVVAAVVVERRPQDDVTGLAQALAGAPAVLAPEEEGEVVLGETLLVALDHGVVGAGAEL